MRKALLLLSSAILAAQTTPLDELEKKVRADPDSFAAGVAACGSNDPKTVPLCRVIFDTAKRKATRQMAAAHMIRRGFKDDTYVGYLFDAARKALQEDLPQMFVYGTDGAMVPEQFNPAFEDWCRLLGLTVQEGIRAVNDRSFDIRMFRVPGHIQIIPLLERGLKNPNEQIASAAAQTLAAHGYSQSLPFIVARVRATPKDARLGFLIALAAFDGREADEALTQFVPEPEKRESLRKMAWTLNGAASWKHFIPIQP
jgi:hypothetical protein